jgi:hypothetical protein
MSNIFFFYNITWAGCKYDREAMRELADALSINCHVTQAVFDRNLFFLFFF